MRTNNNSTAQQQKRYRQKYWKKKYSHLNTKQNTLFLTFSGSYQFWKKKMGITRGRIRLPFWERDRLHSFLGKLWTYVISDIGLEIRSWLRFTRFHQEFVFPILMPNYSRSQLLHGSIDERLEASNFQQGQSGKTPPRLASLENWSSRSIESKNGQHFS